MKEFLEWKEESAESSWAIPDEIDKKLIFAVTSRRQFDRGMINIAGGEPLKTMDDVEGKKMVIVENDPNEVICRYREDTRGGILVVFTKYEYAAWFEDGLDY